MPFQKGQSGNPSGRPKAVQELVALAREHGEETFRLVLALRYSEDERVAFAACKEVLDRGYGKPIQAIKHDGGMTIEHVEISAFEQIRGRVASIAARTGTNGSAPRTNGATSH